MGGSEDAAADSAGDPSGRAARPPAFTSACVFGVLGLVLLLAGLLSRAEPLLLAATTAGCVSLVSALIWRSQLIEAWQRQRRRSSGPGGS